MLFLTSIFLYSSCAWWWFWIHDDWFCYVHCYWLLYVWREKNEIFNGKLMLLRSIFILYMLFSIMLSPLWIIQWRIWFKASQHWVYSLLFLWRQQASGSRYFPFHVQKKFVKLSDQVFLQKKGLESGSQSEHLILFPKCLLMEFYLSSLTLLIHSVDPRKKKKIQQRRCT